MNPKPVAPLGQLVGGGGENSLLRARDSSPINANDSSDSDGEEQNDWERAHNEPTFYGIPATSISVESDTQSMAQQVAPTNSQIRQNEDEKLI